MTLAFIFFWLGVMAGLGGLVVRAMTLRGEQKRRRH